MRAFDIESIRNDFPILARNVYGRPLVYLDSGATAQKPKCVSEAVRGMCLENNANIHRGAHRLASESTTRYEEARETVRAFIGAECPQEIIFTSGATAGLNVAASSLCRLLVGEGDNIVVSQMEHHSNIVPWQMGMENVSTGRGWRGSKGNIRVLPFDDSGAMDIDALEKGLVDDRTKVVALTQCSNVLGTRPDIGRVVEIAHRHGAVVVVDGCQGAVHGDTNVRDLDCDLYAFSGHKLYGPTGVGVLYGKKELLEKMPPLLGGGDMIATVSFGETSWAELPFKFEAGTSNYIGAVGMAEGIKYLSQFDRADVARHEQSLLDAATEALSKIDGLRIYGTAPGKASIVSFTVEGTHASDIGAVLDKLGIAVRTGTHCAQPLLSHYGVQSVCRASFALYNTLEEVDALAAGVERAVKMLRK
ncbi:MAG: SufS family cysteine desulfurase [Alistipes sp.]|jgi:cysteine desulfurase/selenocysteine lyase|nr:SufS family cysteine desulfurase [Alistipes sp.]